MRRWCFQSHSLFRWCGLLVFDFRVFFNRCRNMTHKQIFFWLRFECQRDRGAPAPTNRANTHPASLRVPNIPTRCRHVHIQQRFPPTLCQIPRTFSLSVGHIHAVANAVRHPSSAATPLSCPRRV
ncbi:hypothetical protein LR48_Vigan04g132700 [Vigna angularis]|uniref:Uncharacterized protein n=1 Tax=Phaseolus angularis TaxID=3914 RepID=A0A0L9UF09_PHAAN|nr:hypothetical protein LR48_Vigan04g132700 [Vigna angularis]